MSANPRATKGEPAPRGVHRRHWHHRVHEAWGRRRLHFCFFQFSQLYPQEAVLAELKEIAEDHDVTSYASYELLGEWDLLVRLYMDPFRRPSFQRDAAERLRQFAYQDQRTLEVQEVVRHWVWSDGNRGIGRPRVPEMRDLEKRWPRGELRTINEIEVPNSRRSELERTYCEAKLVTFARHKRGMKLVIAVQRRGVTPDEYMYLRMQSDLATVLDRAGSWLHERSLYACGRESTAPFVVMCRFANEEYSRVRYELLQPIGDIVRELNARLTTYPIISNDLVCFNDRLPPSVVQPAPTDVKALLQGPETTEFEVKGSALTPLDDWLRKGTLPEESVAFYVDTVVREVVGFLNSGGGVVLIGALERDRDKIDHPALKQYEATDHYILCGLLDATFRQRGWDVWERKLRDLLRRHIEPRPGSEVEFRRVPYGDVDLCLIAVDAVEPDYFLLPPKGPRLFCAREGTSTRILDGPDLERHRKRIRAHVRRMRRRDPSGA